MPSRSEDLPQMNRFEDLPQMNRSMPHTVASAKA